MIVPSDYPTDDPGGGGGGSAPPTILSLVSTCTLGSGNGTSQVSFTVNKVVSGSICEVKIYRANDPDQGAVWSYVIGINTNAKSFVLPDSASNTPALSNGDYVVAADNGELKERTFTVACSGSVPPSDGAPLRIDNVAATAVSTYGGNNGTATVTMTDGQVDGSSVSGGVVEVSTDNFTWNRAAWGGSDQWGLVITGFAAGSYTLYARDSNGKTAQKPFAIGTPRRYRLQMAGQPARVYHLQTAVAARRYRLLTQDALSQPRRVYHLATTAAPRVYRLQTADPLAVGDFDTRITPEGDYLVVTIPQPPAEEVVVVDTPAPTDPGPSSPSPTDPGPSEPGPTGPSEPLPTSIVATQAHVLSLGGPTGNGGGIGVVVPKAPTPPIVQAECWDGTYYLGVLRPPAPGAPATADWVFYIGPLATDGVYTVEVLKLAGSADRKEKELVTLRLQLEHGRQLLLPPADYNESAGDLELWLGAGTLAFEAEAYDESHYIISQLYYTQLTPY